MQGLLPSPQQSQIPHGHRIALLILISGKFLQRHHVLVHTLYLLHLLSQVTSLLVYQDSWYVSAWRWGALTLPPRLQMRNWKTLLSL